MEAEFNADAFVQSFEQATMGVAQQSLDADAIIPTLADQYVRNIQPFQADLQEAGLADHPCIDATGIMRECPTVQQVMALLPFVQPLRRKKRSTEHLCTQLRAALSVASSS